MVISGSTPLPWPAHAEGASCAAMVSTGLRTGPGVCPHPVVVSVLVRYSRDQQVWLVFLCARHGSAVPASVPLDEHATQELADRRAQRDLALAGRPYRRPQPLRPRYPNR